MKKLLFLVALCCHAQILSPIFTTSGTSGGGGGITVSVHCGAGSANGSLAQCASGINTVTNTLLVCAVASTVGSDPPSDSVDGGATWTANTWTQIRAEPDGAGGAVGLWYVNSATPVTSALHLFRA